MGQIRQFLRMKNGLTTTLQSFQSSPPTLRENKGVDSKGNSSHGSEETLLLLNVKHSGTQRVMARGNAQRGRAP